ncbi:telethonin [Sardina pilchardus]|uniref:telethonin n=1 Tax=Sardina pilchardus TaxID=27697 RepID=UPI002E0EC181
MHCLSRNPSTCLVNSYSDVKEKDEQRREGYEATWLDVVMETRPEKNATLSEINSLRKETYEQKKLVHFVVRRYLDQTLHMGRYGDKMRRYESRYAKNVLPLPLFVPKNMAQQNDLNQTPIPAEDRSTVEFDKASLIDVCAEKKLRNEIMPPIIQSSRQDFRASRA